MKRLFIDWFEKEQANNPSLNLGGIKKLLLKCFNYAFDNAYGSGFRSGYDKGYKDAEGPPPEQVVVSVDGPPLSPTPVMIEEGAKRLVSWEEDSVWPISWTNLEIARAKNEAERVWRSMYLAHQEGLDK